ncbi:transmembrane protein 214, partial [Caerostris extrusa]
SYTGKFMKDSGLLVVCAQVNEKLKYFQGRAQKSKLSEKYFPVVALWFQETVLPFLELFMKRLSASLVFLWESTLGLRMWCSRTLPPLLALTENHFCHSILEKCALCSLLKSFAVLFSKLALDALAYAFNAADSFATWLQANPQVMEVLGTIKSFAISLGDNLQQNAVHLFQLVKSYIPVLS